MIGNDASESKGVRFLASPAVQISQTLVLITRHIEAEGPGTSECILKKQPFSGSTVSVLSNNIWLVVEFPTHLKNMIVKMGIFPK